MKKYMKILTIIFCVSLFNNLNAQDLITLKTGEEVKSKVLEVGSTEVKYKKFENIQGPTYTILKSDIFMIKYENGVKEVINSVENRGNGNQENTTKSEVKKDVQEGIDQYRASEDYNKYNKIYHQKLVKGIVMTSIGVSFLAAGAGLIAYGVSNIQSENDLGVDIDPTFIACAALGGAFTCVGIPLSIVGPVTLGRSFHYKRLAKEAQRKMAFLPMPYLRHINNAGSSGFAGGMGFRLSF